MTKPLNTVPSILMRIAEIQHEAELRGPLSVQDTLNEIRALRRKAMRLAYLEGSLAWLRGEPMTPQGSIDSVWYASDSSVWYAYADGWRHEYEAQDAGAE